MAYFSWMGQMAALSPAALTIRAQTISPNDEGNLLWDAFFPRRNVDSIRAQTVGTIDFRPVGDRREWNQRGRVIPTRTPSTREIEMIPIETTFSIDEYEIQKLEERTLGNEALFRQIVGVDIPTRTDALVAANYRRVEVDTFTAWALGQITAKDPQTGNTGVLSFGFDAARYTTAPTAWNNGAVNAYDLFIAWLESAVDYVGPLAGAMMRLATFKAIQVDAPRDNAALMLTRAQVLSRVQDDIGGPFQFYINENTQDIFADGGLDVVRTKVWPTAKVAAVPQGEGVGNVDFAPVARAMEIARGAPDAGIDIRGQTVYTDISGAGRHLTVEAQVNAMPNPNENRVFVIDAGV